MLFYYVNSPFIINSMGNIVIKRGDKNNNKKKVIKENTKKQMYKDKKFERWQKIKIITKELC